MHFVVANFWSAPRNLQCYNRHRVHGPRAVAVKPAPGPFINSIPIVGGNYSFPLYAHPTNDPLTPRKRA